MHVTGVATKLGTLLNIRKWRSSYIENPECRSQSIIHLISRSVSQRLLWNLPRHIIDARTRHILINSWETLGSSTRVLVLMSLCLYLPPFFLFSRKMSCHPRPGLSAKPFQFRNQPPPSGSETTCPPLRLDADIYQHVHTTRSPTYFCIPN